MSYRGSGGFGGPIVVRRRPRAGDFSDVMDFGADESSGLDLSSPDFSDVLGGSSTVEVPEDSSSGLSWDTLTSGATALSKFFGPSSAGALGTAAAAGAAALSSPTAKRALRKWIGGRMGRRRRMNPGNFRALRRSMHRLQAFERAARKVVHFTHPKPTARVKFRFRRRRKR